MTATLTLHDLLRIVLYLAGIASLVFLAMVLKNVVDLLKDVKGLLDRYGPEIDQTIKKVPVIAGEAAEIAGNVNVLTTEAQELVVQAKPEIEKVVGAVSAVGDTVNGVTRSVDIMTNKVTNTVSAVSDTMGDTARTISMNANGFLDYYYMIKEVLKALKDLRK